MRTLICSIKTFINKNHEQGSQSVQTMYTGDDRGK